MDNFEYDYSAHLNALWIVTKENCIDLFYKPDFLDMDVTSDYT